MLSIQSSLELPPAMVIDDLHCIYLGVTKLLLNLWFGKKFRMKDFSIRRKVWYNCAVIMFMFMDTYFIIY